MKLRYSALTTADARTVPSSASLRPESKPIGVWFVEIVRFKFVSWASWEPRTAGVGIRKKERKQARKKD